MLHGEQTAFRPSGRSGRCRPGTRVNVRFHTAPALPWRPHRTAALRPSSRFAPFTLRLGLVQPPADVGAERIAKILVDQVKVEPFRVEISSCPAKMRLVVFMLWVPDCLHEITVGPWATYVLGRPGEASGVTYWTNQLDAGKKSRGQVMVNFSESNEYKRKTAALVDVIDLYTGLLRRVRAALWDRPGQGRGAAPAARAAAEHRAAEVW